MNRLGIRDVYSSRFRLTNWDEILKHSPEWARNFDKRILKDLLNYLVCYRRLLSLSFSHSLIVHDFCDVN